MKIRRAEQGAGRLTDCEHPSAEFFFFFFLALHSLKPNPMGTLSPLSSPQKQVDKHTCQVLTYLCLRIAAHPVQSVLAAFWCEWKFC